MSKQMFVCRFVLLFQEKNLQMALNAKIVTQEKSFHDNVCLSTTNKKVIKSDGFHYFGNCCILSELIYTLNRIQFILTS